MQRRVSTPWPSACPNIYGINSTPKKTRLPDYMSIWRAWMLSSLPCTDPEGLIRHCHDCFGKQDGEPQMPDQKVRASKASNHWTHGSRRACRPASGLHHPPRRR